MRVKAINRAGIILLALGVLLVLTAFLGTETALADQGDLVIASFATDKLKDAVDAELGRLGLTYTDVTSLSFDPGAGQLGDYDFPFIQRNLRNLIDLDMGNVSLKNDSDTLPNIALNNLPQMKTVTLPAGVTNTGNTAFQSCSSLESVTGTIQTVGSNAFSYCTNLNSITLQDNATVGSNAFIDCKALTTVRGTISSLGTFAFSGCNALASVQLPDGASIPSAAFQDCWVLTTVGDITIGSIGSSAFTRCRMLETIKFKDGIVLGGTAFYGCTALTTVIGKPKEVGNSTFDGCTKLKTIDLSDVTFVGDFAFDSCAALQTADLSKVASIGRNAFIRCSSLLEVDLTSVTSVGNNAFYDCSSLYDVTWWSGVPSTVGQLAFYGCALDFSGNFVPPAGLVASQPGGQVPRVYFKLERSSDIITQGVAPAPPWSIKTKNGTPYADIIGESWVDQNLSVPSVTPALDITTLGTRDYTFSIDPALFADTHTVGPYKLTVIKAPAPDPKPNVDPNTEYPLNEQGGASIEVPFTNVVGELPVVLTAEDEAGNVMLTLSSTVGTDGKARFELTPGQIAGLAPGTYYLYIESPGNAFNKPIPKTAIGKLIIKYRPTVSGANDLAILPSSTFQLSFAAVLGGSDPKNPIALTLNVGDSTAIVSQTGDGKVSFALAVNANVAGSIPVTLSAPATDTTQAIPETKIGEISVLDASKYLAGDLRTRLGDGWLYGKVKDGVPVAFQPVDALLDEDSGILSIQNKDKLVLGIYYNAPGGVTGTLERVRVSPFVQSKALQTAPNKLRLSAEGKIKNKTATFDFSAQDMNRLEPGYYTFSIESKAKGSHKGFGPLALATVQVLAGEAEPVAWTMPKTLRASVGQQYQLVTPIPAGGALPVLTVANSNKKVAAISGTGVLTAKKTGKATITILAADGTKLKCAVTVVSNSFSRSKPLMLKANGLYTSTKRLYYQKGALVAEVFVYNRTGATIRGAAGFTFELYDGEQLVFSRPLGALTFKTPLKDKNYKTFRLTITDELLPGVSEKALDLGGKRYNAVIRGTDGNGNQAVPLASWSKGVTQPKAQNAKSAGSEQPKMIPSEHADINP